MFDEKIEIHIANAMCNSNSVHHLCNGDNEQKSVKLELKKTIAMSREAQKYRSTLSRNRMKHFIVKDAAK